MCVVSMVGDWWQQQHPKPYQPQYPPETMGQTIIWPQVTKQEFEALRSEVESLKKLLLAAKEFDKATGQPDCENEEKVKAIKEIARLVGVDLTEVFGK